MSLRRASGSGGLNAVVGGRMFAGKMFVGIVAVSDTCLIGLTAEWRSDGLSTVVSGLRWGCSTLLIEDMTLGRDECVVRIDLWTRPLSSRSSRVDTYRTVKKRELGVLVPWWAIDSNERSCLAYLHFSDFL